MSLNKLAGMEGINSATSPNKATMPSAPSPSRRTPRVGQHLDDNLDGQCATTATTADATTTTATTAATATASSSNNINSDTTTNSNTTTTTNANTNTDTNTKVLFDRRAGVKIKTYLGDGKTHKTRNDTGAISQNDQKKLTDLNKHNLKYTQLFSFNDLTQEIIGTIPLDLLKNWYKSEKTIEVQCELLKPFIKRGLCISTDSAGLSKISKVKPLLEVLWAIHQPKELIFARGTAVGGSPIGVWAADNTCMFYPTDSCPAASVISAILQAQQEVIKNCVIQIGCGAHAGEYIYIGGHMYGENYNLMEDLAEEHTKGGQILLTDSVAASIANDARFVMTDHRVEELEITTHDLIAGPDFVHLQQKIEDFTSMPKYPAGFSNDFFDLLRSCRSMEEISAKTEIANNFK